MRRKTGATGQCDNWKWADVAGGQGTITNLTVEGHNTVAAQGDVQVHNVVRVERITAQHPDSPDVTVENMAIKLDSARTGVLLDGAVAYEFGKIRVGNADLGAIRAGLRDRKSVVSGKRVLVRVESGGRGTIKK